MAASGAAAGELRSRETSTPRAVRALQSSSPAALAESRVARQNRMPTPTRCNRTRRARHVPPAICSRSPQTCGGPRDPPATPTDGDWANPPNKGANCCSANYCCGRCGSHGQRRPAERRARRAPPVMWSYLLADPGGGLAYRFFPLRGPVAPGPGRGSGPRARHDGHLLITRACDTRALRSRHVSPYAPRGTAIAAVPLAQRSSIRFALQPAKSTS